MSVFYSKLRQVFINGLLKNHIHISLRFHRHQRSCEPKIYVPFYLGTGTVASFHFAEKRNFPIQYGRLVKSLSSVRCGGAHFLMADSRVVASFLLNV